MTMPSDFFVDFSSSPKFTEVNLLAMPGIPAPLWGLAPRRWLGSEWWDEIRLKAYDLNNFCCWACGEKPSANPLEGHEVFTYDNEARRATLVDVAGLCRLCHQWIHRGRLKMIGDTRTYNDVREHFLRVTRGKTCMPKAAWEWSPIEVTYHFREWHVYYQGKVLYTPYANELHARHCVQNNVISDEALQGLVWRA